MAEIEPENNYWKSYFRFRFFAIYQAYYLDDICSRKYVIIFDMERWDTIVVGSGIGGLTAAACLVNSGLRVLVLERNAHVGGTAYTFQRKNYSFPMGPLSFSSCGLVNEILEGIGESNGCKFRPVRYKIHAFDLEIVVSQSFPRVIDKLAQFVPAQIGDVERFFDYMERILAAIRSPDGEADREILENASRISAAEYLEKSVKDWRLRRILGSIGTQEPYSGLPLLAAMWNLISNEGIYYPQGGMRKFCDGLAEVISQENAVFHPHKSGFGEIRLNSEATRIRIGHDKVEGVRLRNGMKIDAATVISNADYKTTFLKLIEPKAIPSTFLSAISDARQTKSNFQVCLGLDVSKVDLKVFNESSRLIYRGLKGHTEQLYWKAEEIDISALTGQELEISLWSADDPSLAPEGGAVLVIRTEADHDHFDRYRLAPRQRVPGYQEYKTRLGKALIQEVERLVPGLSDAIVVMDIATPLTFEERGGRSGGAVAGWSWDYQDDTDYVPRELVRTPIRGLYLAGYQAFSSLFLGGVSTAMESGRRAAESVLCAAAPIEEVRIPRGK